MMVMSPVRSAFDIKIVMRYNGVSLLHPDHYIAGDETAKMIYYDVKNISACFRRLNATHQIGCSCKHSTEIFLFCSICHCCM